jgi:hypothetical protein
MTRSWKETALLTEEIEETLGLSELVELVEREEDVEEDDDVEILLIILLRGFRLLGYIREFVNCEENGICFISLFWRLLIFYKCLRSF